MSVTEFDPGEVVVVNGREYTVKKRRGRFIEFTDGSEMQITRAGLAQYAEDQG